MADPVLGELWPHLSGAPAPALWVTGEGDRPLPPPAGFKGAALTNRADMAAALNAAGWLAHLNDFDFTAAEAPRAIFYRIGKEKAVVRRVINQCAEVLPPGGSVTLCGHKQEGIRPLIAAAAERLGGAASVERCGNGIWRAQIEAGTGRGPALDDSDYDLLRPIAQASPPGGAEALELWSKPGVFGWNKIDRGSALLVQQLPALLAARPQPAQVIDLGCGYGYLSVLASRLVDAQFLATDNGVGAVAACRKNFQVHGLRGAVSLGDCGDELDEPVPLLLCNPPFHQGFDHHRDLIAAFLQAAHRLLRPGGTAVFVVNRFIGLERIAVDLFQHVTQISDDGSFRVFALERER